jgi:hypothetical protein
MDDCKGVGLHYTRFRAIFRYAGIDFIGFTSTTGLHFFDFAVELSKSG